MDKDIRSAFRKAREALNAFEQATSWMLKVSGMDSPDSMQQAAKSLQSALKAYQDANEELSRVLSQSADGLVKKN